MSESADAVPPPDDLSFLEGSAPTLPLVYERAREIASRTLSGDRARQWVRASSLVQMAFLRLIQEGGLAQSPPQDEHARLLAVLTTIMRRTVVDVVRATLADKRGPEMKISLHTTDLTAPKPAIGVLEIDDAMNTLARICSETARVAELRLWGGMEFEQIAQAMGIPLSRVRSRWNRAKAYLAKDLSENQASGAGGGRAE